MPTDPSGIGTVTAVYDRVVPPHLASALDALGRQTLIPDDIVVVADGPLTPELDRVLDDFARSLPLRVIRLPEHAGSGPAKQAGVEACTAGLVAIVDADDISVAHRLQRQRDVLVSDEVDLVGSAMQEFDDASGEIWGIRRFPGSHEQIMRAMRTVNPINHPSVAFKRQAVLDAGGYGNLPYLEDYDLWARMAAHGARLRNLDEPLVLFRGGGASLTRRRARGVTVSEWRLQRNLVAYGTVSRPLAAYNFVARTAFRMLPGALMRRAYRRLFLRRRADESAPTSTR